MDKEYVWYWHWDLLRHGVVEAVFVATEEQVENVIGESVYFGDVLGKHSDVHGTLEKEEFKKLSDEPKVINFIKQIGSFGYNPLHYTKDNYE